MIVTRPFIRAAQGACQIQIQPLRDQVEGVGFLVDLLEAELGGGVPEEGYVDEPLYRPGRFPRTGRSARR